jgi:predicted metal-dependent peptidase
MSSFDPTKLGPTHPLSVGMRTVARHWHLAYSKLLSLDWRWSDSTPYGSTDGRVLFVNQAGIDKLMRRPNGTALVAFLLVHESLHALLGHGWRCSKMRDQRTANVAADYIINAMIAMRNKELGRAVFPLIEGVLIDEKLSGDKSVEQLYRELLKPQPKQEEPQPKQDESKADNDGDEGDDECSDSDSDSEGEGEGEEAAASGGSSEDEAAADDGHSTGEPDGGVDGAADVAATAAVGGDDDLSDFVGTGAPDTMAPLTEEGESEDEAVQQIETDNDRLLLADHIDRLTRAEGGAIGTRIATQRSAAQPLDWVTLLREWLRARTRSGWGSPFNPAVYGGAGLVCAGRRTRAARDIVLVIDTSGSVPQRAYDRFLTEAQAVLDELKPERLHLLSVSHYVCDVHTLESGKDTVPKKLKGGGGTMFQPAFDWIQQQGLEVDVLVYLTDGFAFDLRSLQEPDYPVLWASTVLQQRDYPFGDTVMVTDI